MVGGVKSHLESKPYPPETFRGLKQTSCAPGHRNPAETETGLCLSALFGGMGQPWTATEAGALSAADLGMAGCSRPGYGISPLGGGHHKPHHRDARTYTGLGK